MRIELERTSKAYDLEARNERGQKVHVDGATAIGGGDNAYRPMELLLAALAGCSAIDVIHMLKEPEGEAGELQVTVDGERNTESTPALFKSIHIHFEYGGAVAKEKFERAVQLSIEKYCSVAKILEKSADLTYSSETLNR
jgi:putative redox protein